MKAGVDTSSLARALRAAAEAQRATAEALEALALVVSHAPQERAEPAPEAVEAVLLTVKEVAARTGMSSSWVYRAVEEGRIPTVRMGNRVRIHVDALNEFIRSRDTQPR